ncbi:MAG: plasmid mobilization protein [Acidobacteriaceae bacterium]
MAENNTLAEQVEGIVRPSVKSKQIGVRVTEAEYAALEREAWRTGHKVGDWARDQLLERMKQAEDDRISAHVFTELIGLQMLLMSSFSPLVQGKTLTAEQYQELIRNVQSGKGKRARELLLQRANQEGK